MNLTKNAVGNLINRYKTVLKKCHLMNTFGSLAIAGMLVMGAAGVAGAATSLTDVDANVNTPEATLKAGNLTYEGNVIVGGLVDNNGNENSTIVSNGKGNINLFLTGQGAANGVLSQGDITASFTDSSSAAIILSLGGDIDTTLDAKIEGNLTLNGSNKGKNVVLNIDGINLTVAGDVFLTRGADAIIGTVADMTLNVKNIVIGSADSTSLTLFQVGKFSTDTDLTFSKGIVNAETFTVIEENVNLWNGEINTKTFTVSGKSLIGVGAGTRKNGMGELNVVNGINIVDTAIIGIGQGEINTTFITVGEDAKLLIGSANAAINTAVVNLSDAATYKVSDFMAATGSQATAGAGKISLGKTGTFNVNNTLTLTGGGNLNMYATSTNDDDEILTASGTIGAKGFVFGAATNLTGGHLNLLAGTGIQTLSGALTVNNTRADSNVTVMGGTWATDSRITITNGKLMVSSGASLDVQSGLTIGAAGAGDIQGTLTANLADFGTVNLSGALGSQFSDIGAKVAVDLINGADTVLNLYASSGTTIDEDVYTALIAELQKDIFGDNLGIVNLYGYEINVSSSLADVMETYNEPRKIIGAGSLTFEGITTVGGLVAYKGVIDSTIVSQGENAKGAITLNLTGEGAANGVLSQGDITASFAADNTTTGLTAKGSGIILNIGAKEDAVAEVSIKGNLTLLGSNNNSGPKNALLNIEGTNLTVDGDVLITKGADVNIGRKADATLNAKNIVIGSADSTSLTLFTLGKFSTDTDQTSSKAIVNAEKITIIAENLNLNQGEITTDTFEVSGKNLIGIGAGTRENGKGTLNVANGINIVDGTVIGIGQGEINTTFITVDAASKLLIGNANAAINTAVVNLSEAATYKVSDFMATTGSQNNATAGKITFGKTGTFNVDNTLTLNGGGDLNLYATTTTTDKEGVDTTTTASGTIGAKGFVFGAATNLTGGHLNLLAGSGIQTLSGALTVNSIATDAVNKSTVTVKGGTWTTDSRITITNGKLIVAKDASLDVQKGLTIGAAGAGDIQGTLTANLADFGIVDLSGGTGSLFDESSANVSVNLTGGEDAVLTLNVTPGTTIDEDRYNELIAEIQKDIFGDTLGTVELDGYVFVAYTSISDLEELYNEPMKILGAGSLTFEGVTTVGGLVAYNGETASTIISEGENAKGPITLNLTGQGTANGVLSHGDITASFAADNTTTGLTAKGSGIILNLGDGEGGEVSIKGNLTILGSNNGGASRNAILNIEGNELTVEGDVLITKGADVNIGRKADATLNAKNIVIGSADSTSLTLFTLGKFSTDADQTSSKAIVNAEKITIIAENLNLNQGEITTDTFEVSGRSFIGIGAGTRENGKGTLNVTNGINIVDGTQIGIGQGEINTTFITVDATSKLVIGNANAAINTAVVNLSEAATYKVNDFAAATTGVTTAGKITFGKTGFLNVDNTLTLTGGGDLNMYATTTSTDKEGVVTIATASGTIGAKGFVFGAATNLTGGHLNLLAGTGAQTLAGALTVNSIATDAVNKSRVTVMGGEWKTTAALTVTKGTLNISGGTLDVSGATFTTSGADAELISAKDTKLIVNIGTIGSDAKGKITDTATVNKDTVTTDLLGNVTIKGFTKQTLAYATGYTAIVQAAQASYGKLGSITLENITADTTNIDLGDVANNSDTSLGGNTVKTGTVESTETAVVGSISDKDVSGNAAKNEGTLTVTGKTTDGTTSGVIAVGNMVNSGTGTMTLGNSDADSTLTGSIKSSGTATTANRLIISGSVETTGGDTTVTASTINENITIAGKGTTAVTATTVNGDFKSTSTGDTTIAGKTTVGGTTAVAGKLDVVANATLETNNLEGAADVVINVGTESGKGELVVKTTATLNGATIFLDPAFKDNVGIEGASTGALAGFAGDKIDGKLIAGQNSYIVLGASDTKWAQESFKNSGLTWGATNVTAALFINSAQTLDATLGAINVNGELKANPAAALVANTANFDANSLLVVNASNLGGKAALTATTGTLNVVKTSTLVISGGKAGDKVTVATGFDKAASSVLGWGAGEALVQGKSTTIMTDSRAVGIGSSIWNPTTGTFTADLKLIQVVLPDVDQSVNAFLTEAGSAALTGTSKTFIDYVNNTATNAKVAGVTAQGTPQAASVAAVGASAMNVATAASGAITARNSATSMGFNAQTPTSVALSEGVVSVSGTGNAMKNGIGVWLMPLYKWSSVNGMGSSGFESGYNTGLGGVAFGADYTMNAAFRIGLALNVGAGYTNSSGDFNDSTNDFDFWGLSLYANYQRNNFGLSADIGYSGISNEVDQDMPAASGLGSSSSNVHTEVWTAGLNAEYIFSTEFMDISPHAGVRYMGVKTNSHDIENGGNTLFNVDESHQGVWYFPVGVTLSKNVTMESGWTITPKLDVGLIAAAGDFDAKSRTSMPGVATGMNVEMQNVDGFAFNGGIGFDIGKDNVKFGINYNLQASEHETGHMVFGTLRYEF